ncbi:hypothetical protein [Teredinibacter sp. KSP-S5-2]|uniref:hypothetical protein n=1 Tax=Teredinibacter sp. KSP-S5-2 TaxID=3034506 RepID=UPI002934237E|nr:hypothetical protein [Teredinibacter sp. KSP-S5-2]WNO11164.1 hypothetical protein P5V12_08260 [Teredinibacter sp. KSP-S5-2]
MKSILLIMLLFPFFAWAENNECSDIVGEWIGERYDRVMESQRTLYSKYRADGTYSFSFEYISGSGKSAQTESGEWWCIGTNLYISNTELNGELLEPDIQVYNILALTASYMKISIHDVDCEQAGDDCHEGVIYENTRM